MVAKLFRNEKVITQEGRFTTRVYDFLDSVGGTDASDVTDIQNDISTITADITDLQAEDVVLQDQITALQTSVTALEAIDAESYIFMMMGA